MGATAARVAGVEEVVVCSPPGPGGDVDPAVLGACAVCGVDEVYRMGGAQAVAALALGTQGVPRVDVVAGPGNVYVQEAKRQLSDVVGIDSFAGPSELLALLDGEADARLAALDLRAQSEHGPESLLVAVSPSDETLDAVGDELEAAPAESAPACGPAAARLAPAGAAIARAEGFALHAESMEARIRENGLDG